MSRFNRLILLLGSTVALTLVVIGIPVALIYLVGCFGVTVIFNVPNWETWLLVGPRSRSTT
jgi:uncharacterized membrane protein